MGIVFGGGSLGAAIMSIATNLLVQQVDVAWTFRILGFMLWGVCIPASYFIQQPSGAASAGLKLQWYKHLHLQSPCLGADCLSQVSIQRSAIPSDRCGNCLVNLPTIHSTILHSHLL